MVTLLVVGEILIKAILGLGTCVVLGFMVMRLESKVKKVEKMCDKLKTDPELVKGKAMECKYLVDEYEVDTQAMFNKLKPIVYQVDLQLHTIYLCKVVNNKSLLVITIHGDSKLENLFYKLDMDFSANKVKIYCQREDCKILSIDFCNRLIKYCT
jgi:hypothetical protein